LFYTLEHVHAENHISRLERSAGSSSKEQGSLDIEIHFTLYKKSDSESAAETEAARG
jgi:hypothetical protein